MVKGGHIIYMDTYYQISSTIDKNIHSIKPYEIIVDIHFSNDDFKKRMCSIEKNLNEREQYVLVYWGEGLPYIYKFYSMLFNLFKTDPFIDFSVEPAYKTVLNPQKWYSDYFKLDFTKPFVFKTDNFRKAEIIQRKVEIALNTFLKKQEKRFNSLITETLVKN